MISRAQRRGNAGAALVRREMQPTDRPRSLITPPPRSWLEKKVQSACKPGFVWPRGRPRNVAAIPLGRRLRAASSDQPGRRSGDGSEACASAVPIRSCSRRGLPCHVHCWTCGALLPHPFTLTRTLARRAVCFLWRFPWGHPRRTLSGAVSPWSPDFPLPRRSGRPADWRIGGYPVTRDAATIAARIRACRTRSRPRRCDSKVGGARCAALRKAHFKRGSV